MYDSESNQPTECEKAKIEKGNLKAKCSLSEIKEDTYKADIALLGRYQAYSSELLRLSLAGIGFIGFLVTHKLLENEGIFVKLSFIFSVALFGLSAAFALAHRYYSSDGIYYHLRAIRNNSCDNDVKKDTDLRNTQYDKSECYLRLSAVTLGFGASFLAIGIIIKLW